MVNVGLGESSSEDYLDYLRDNWYLTPRLTCSIVPALDFLDRATTRPTSSSVLTISRTTQLLSHCHEQLGQHEERLVHRAVQRIENAGIPEVQARLLRINGCHIPS